MINQLAPADLASWRADASRDPPFILDVREPWEYRICSIDDSVLVPLGELASRLRELPRDRELVVVCHHGVRSLTAAAWLARSGFRRVHNLRGGMAAWAEEVDPATPRY